MKAPVLRLLAASRGVLKETLRPPLSPSLETKQIEFRSFDWLQPADPATSASRHASQKLRLQRPRRVATRPPALERTAANFLCYRGCSKLNALARLANYRVPENTPFPRQRGSLDGCAVVPGEPHTRLPSLLLFFLFFFWFCCPLPCTPAGASHGGGCEARPANRRRDDVNKNIKRGRLLFDCCVHLYTSLHHYGLFSLQIKPETVQISRRLKSF